MAAFAYLQLDPNYDPIFTVGNSLTNGDAVAQAVLTRLRLWMGEWWEDLLEGLPVTQSMLGVLGSSSNLEAIKLAIIQRIAGTPYVTSILDVEVGFIGGVYSFTATVQTYFGVITVAVPTPGQAASV
jgi:hypothetical protein